MFVLTDRGVTLLTLLSALAVKLVLWSIYGPVVSNDTALYSAFAQMLLQDDWSWQYRFFDDPTPVTGLRMIGYPAIFAFSQLIAGDRWADMVVGLQIVVALAAVGAATRWALRLCGSPAKAIVTGLSLALGQAAIYDIHLLPDSLFSSLAILILCTLSAGRSDRASNRPVLTALLCGLAVAAMCLLRANGLHIAILFSPLAIVWLLSTRRMLIGKTVMLVLPVVITVQAYMFWNLHRTGEWFLSTGAQYAAFQPLYEIAQYGTNVFTDDGTLSKTVRATTSTFAYADIGTLNRALKTQHGWTSIDVAQAGTRKFVETVFAQPWALTKNAGRAFDFSVIRTLINPALAVTEAHHLITGERLFPGASKILKSIGSQSPSALFYVAVYTAGVILSTILFASFLIATPLKCLRSSERSTAVAVLALWAGTLAMLAYYSFIHLEIRYILAAIPVITGIGLWAFPSYRPRRSIFARHS